MKLSERNLAASSIKVRGLVLSILLSAVLLLSGCYYVPTEDEPAVVTLADGTEIVISTLPNEGAIKGATSDTTNQTIWIDWTTHAIKSVDFSHAEIHEGDAFSCWYEQTVSDVGDKSIISFRTPDTADWIHMIYEASATVAAEVMILEAPLITKGTGANLTIYNRDRNSLTASTVINTAPTPEAAGAATYFTEATMGNVTGGTEITHAHLAVGTGPKVIGGSDRGTQEWILKQDTLYAFVISSLSADDNTQTVKLIWYEHINRSP